MRSILVFALLAVSAQSATFTISPGHNSFGNGKYNYFLNETLTVTTSGSPAAQARSFIYTDIDGVVRVSLPPGISGTCSASTDVCDVFTTHDETALQNGALYVGSDTQYPNITGGRSLYWLDPIFNTTASSSGAKTLMEHVPDPVSWLSSGTDSYELGTRFTSDVDGYIIGVRYYKRSGDAASSRNMILWNTAGTSIATAATSSEPASGWITANFASPVAITANTVYTVSTHASGQVFFSDNYYQNHNIRNGHLVSLADYQYGDDCYRSVPFPRGFSGRELGSGIACITWNTSGAITGIQGADTFGSDFLTEGAQGMVGPDGPGPYILKNTFISGAGNLWHHSDEGAGFAHTGDFTYTRDEWDSPLWCIQSISHQEDCENRQTLEWKNGHRIKVDANKFHHAYVDIANASLSIAFTSVAQFGGGITDVEVANTTFSDVSGGMNGPDSTQGGAPQTPPVSRFWYHNNLFTGIDGPKWSNPGNTCAQGGIVGRGWILEGVNDGEDFTFEHNTVDHNQGCLAAMFFLGPVPLEGFVVRNNLLWANYSWDAQGGIRFDGGMNSNAGGDCHALLNAAAWACMFPNSVMSNNVILSDNSTRSTVVTDWGYSGANYVPTSQTTQDTMRFWSLNDRNYHLKDTSCFSAGATAAKCNDTVMKGSDGESIGADMTKLEQAQGKVYFVSAVPGSTSAAVNFVAPDGQSCPVDISSSDSDVISTFTRTNDSGTKAGPRSVSIGSLSAHTVYYGRVNCAVEQPMFMFRTN